MYNYQVSNLTNDAAVSVQGEERLHAAIHKLLDAGLNVRDIGIVLEDAEATDDEETILAAIDARILANEGGNPVVESRLIHARDDVTEALGRGRPLGSKR